MSITPEDGTGSNPDANSYIDADYLQDYAEARGENLPATVEPLLIKAMDYLGQIEWKGRRAHDNQPLAWPRMGVRIDGRVVPDDEIPKLLKDAQAQLAIYANGTDLLPQSDGRITTSEKVGPIEVQYAESSRVPVPTFPKVDGLLSGLIAGGGSVLWLSKV